MKTKALISSTAILLVAVMMLVATGYAWFTAGESAKISQFNLSVDQEDSALLLAPADFSSNYVAKAYESTLDLSDWQSTWCVKGNTLSPVSTATAAKNSFYFLGYDEANNQWGGTTATGAKSEGYILLSFWAKAPVAGTADFSVDFSGDGVDTFNTAVKFAYNVSATAAPGEMNIYDLAVETNDKYQPVAGADAICTKESDAAKRPQFVAKSGTFADARAQVNSTDDTNTLWTNASSEKITFAADVPQLFTVAIWLEGMDADCQGANWNLDDIAVDIQFNNWTVA